MITLNLKSFWLNFRTSIWFTLQTFYKHQFPWNGFSLFHSPSSLLFRWPDARFLPSRCRRRRRTVSRKMRKWVLLRRIIDTQVSALAFRGAIVTHTHTHARAEALIRREYGVCAAQLAARFEDDWRFRLGALSHRSEFRAFAVLWWRNVGGRFVIPTCHHLKYFVALQIFTRGGNLDLMLQKGHPCLKYVHSGWQRSRWVGGFRGVHSVVVERGESWQRRLFGVWRPSKRL